MGHVVKKTLEPEWTAGNSFPSYSFLTEIIFHLKNSIAIAKS